MQGSGSEVLKTKLLKEKIVKDMKQKQKEVTIWEVIKTLLENKQYEATKVLLTEFPQEKRNLLVYTEKMLTQNKVEEAFHLNLGDGTIQSARQVIEAIITTGNSPQWVAQLCSKYELRLSENDLKKMTDTFVSQSHPNMNDSHHILLLAQKNCPAKQVEILRERIYQKFLPAQGTRVASAGVGSSNLFIKNPCYANQ